MLIAHQTLGDFFALHQFQNMRSHFTVTLRGSIHLYHKAEVLHRQELKTL